MNPKPVKLSQVKHHWEIYLFVLPTVLLVALFQYYPASSGIFHSFFRWNGADISEFRLFENYIDLCRNSEFWLSFKLAFILGGWNVIKMIPALFVAVAIHRCRSERMQFLYRTLFVVPMVIPGLVVVLIWRSFFFESTAGYLNQFLIWSGLFDVLVRLDQVFEWGGIFVHGKMPAWLGDPRLIVTACVLWGFPWVGSFAVLTHLAKLQNISKDIYEAAEIDGVNWWSRFTRIELPLIMGSIYLLLVFVIIDTVKDAGMILALAGIYGGPGGKATVPALFMIRKAFLDQQMGYACAVGIVLTLVVMLLQKTSNALMGGEDATSGGRGRIRLFLWIVMCVLVYFGQTFPAIVLLLALFPYSMLTKRVTLTARSLIFRVGLLVMGLLALLFKLAAPALSLVRNGLTSGVASMQASLFAGAEASTGPTMKLLLSQLAEIANILMLPEPSQLVNVVFGVVAVVVAVPWANAARPSTKPAPAAAPAKKKGPSPGDLYVQRAFERQNSPFYRMLSGLGEASLRFVKHFYIWLVLAFAFLPLYLMIIVSVKNNEQFYLAPATLTSPVFWENWKTAWDLVTPTVANSLFIATSSTMLTLGLALCAAYFFSRLKMPASGFLWNALLILMMMPAIANLVPLFILLRDMNLLNTLAALIIVGASGGQIFGIFVLRNFISDTPQDLFEAAEIDGANHFQQLRNIVLPLSGPILGTVGVMHFISAWNDFVLPLIIIRDHARLPVMVQLLRMAGEYIKLWGPLMAGYAIASIPIIILFVFSMKLFVKGLTEGAVKG